MSNELNNNQISRRELIRLGLAFIAGGISLKLVDSLGLTSPFSPGPSLAEQILTDNPLVSINVEPIPAEFRAERYSDKVNLDYVRNTLIPELTSSKINDSKRLQAVMDNISWISFDGGWGTALRVDDSGYYLTVAHNFFELDREHNAWGPLKAPSFEIHHPKTGILSRISSILPTFGADFALVFAPNGNPKKTVENLQIAFPHPIPESRFWVLFHEEAYPPRQIIGLTSGVHKFWQPADVEKGYYPFYLSESFPIRGAQPWFGASGGPILNRNGIVIGLEEGSYPKVQNENVMDLLGGIGITLNPLRSKPDACISADENYKFVSFPQ